MYQQNNLCCIKKSQNSEFELKKLKKGLNTFGKSPRSLYPYKYLKLNY